MRILNQTKQRGFTIVELLIVIVVIGILATLTIVSYSGITGRANTVKAQTNVNGAQKVAEAFNADNGRYPATAAEFVTNPATTPSTKLPSGVTVISGLPGTNATTYTGTIPLNSTNGLNTVSYSCFISCTNSTGGRIDYWNFSSNVASNALTPSGTIFVGSASSTATGAYVVLP